MKNTRILKIVVLISYLSIMLIGDKIGGPVILFIILGLFADDFANVLISAILVMAIMAWVFSIIKADVNIDKKLIPVLWLTLLIPLVLHITYLANYDAWIRNPGILIFIGMTSVFIVLSAFLLKAIFFYPRHSA